MKPDPRELLVRFRPLPAQKQFLLATDPFIAYVGGYGSGKTHALCHKAIRLSGDNPGLPGMIVAPTYSMLRDVVIRSFCEILDSHRIGYRLHKTNWVLTTEWRGEIWFRSADNPETLRGPNLPWVGIDEMALLDPEVWQVLIARVRHPRARRRQVFGVTTPEGLNWVYEIFVEAPRPGHRIIFADTRENTHLPPEYVRSLLHSFDEDGVKQYVEGRFVASGTRRVYKHFDPALHLADSSPLAAAEGEAQPSEHGKQVDLLPDLPLCLACDFNVDPCVWLLLQHHRGTVFVADEIVQRNTTTQEMIDEFERRGYAAHPAGVIVYGDPAGYARSTVAASSDYQLLRAAGLGRQRVPRSHGPVRDRVNAVNTRLRDASGRAHLRIHQRCRTLRRDLLRVRYQAGTATIDKTSDHGLTHATDALGYFMIVEYPIVRGLRGPESVWNVLSR